LCKIIATISVPPVEAPTLNTIAAPNCRKDHCKTKLQEHVMCKWRTKGINSFTGTYIERQSKRGINSPAHGADSKEEKNQVQQVLH